MADETSLTIQASVTVAEYSNLQKAFDFFNDVLFEGKLRQVLVTLNRHPKSKGYFAADRFNGRASNNVVGELALNPDCFTGRSDEEILSTLVHEMCHLWQRIFGRPQKPGYHDRQWGDKMQSIGLMPSHSGQMGGRKTGDKMTHYIITDGPYQQAYARLQATGYNLEWESQPEVANVTRQRKNDSKRKFTCPKCGQNVWGKGSHLRPDSNVNVMCGDCSEIPDDANVVFLRKEGAFDSPAPKHHERIAPVNILTKIRLYEHFQDEAVCVDAIEGVSVLPPNSIDALICSPPYADQRKGLYPGIPERDYPAFWVKLMTAMKPKLKEDGNVIIVIRSHVLDECVSDYVYRTILAVRDSGWNQPEEQIWHKPDTGQMGSKLRLRRSFEHILHFSKAKQPYIDIYANGQPTTRKGFVGGKNQFGLYKSISDGVKGGTAVARDVFAAAVGGVDKGVNHPAIYPPSLVAQLIMTYSRPGGTILDPFAGSGTTLLVARSLGRSFIGFEIKQDFVDLINDRLLNDRRYQMKKVS